MSEITLNLDEALLERLRTVALTRGCSMEVLIGKVLHEFLPPAVSIQTAEEMAMTATNWNNEEAAFLKEALRALDDVPAGTRLVAPDAAEGNVPDA